MAFPKAITTKPFLITNAEYQEVGQNITLVGFDDFAQRTQETKTHASPRLLNWVEPYLVAGENKTMFYTEVNSNIKAGDKVFIINGTYDSDLLIKKDKYKKGRDGYTVLAVDGCKIALDIAYTGDLPYKEEPIDNYIRVYYIGSEDAFVAANRQMTTRGGRLDYKFNQRQNNIAFIDSIYGPIEEWGRNGGVYGVPGFFVREENTFVSDAGSAVSIKEQWNNISDSLVYLGSFSVALSATYSNNGKILIMDGSFTYGGTDFKEGTAYSWNSKSSRWEADVERLAPIISKSNFRSGTFKGKFNSGTYGSQERKISWSGEGIWNGGTIVNSVWKSGTMNSAIEITPSLKAEKDQYGIPFQKPNTSNNGGFGFNYVLGCDIESSTIQNGNFYDTRFSGSDGTYSVVEAHLLGITQSYDNKVVKAFFDTCEFRSIDISGGEIKNARSFNSRFSNIKSVNSYFEQSVIKDSTYIGDGVMKILGYDEWNMSEYRSRTSGTYSYIGTPNSKIYKFYISKESFDRMKSRDAFFIKGIKIKNAAADAVIDFFDGKFMLSSWNAFFDDLSTSDPIITKTPKNTFYKRGYEMAAFLSTPEENSYAISSYEVEYNRGGSTYSKYRTEIVGPNAKKGYSIDIVASRHDIFNKSNTLESSTDRHGQIPRDYNYGTEVPVGTASMPNYIGDNIDFANAYIIDANFESGIIETSDWNSGYHINYNNDSSLGGPTASGRYDMSLDMDNDGIIVRTPFKTEFPEVPGEGTFRTGDVVFLNAVDYDTRGMVTSITIMATGSSYSTTNANEPAYLTNTKISSSTMSSTGSGYFSSESVETVARTGSGSGLVVDILANTIGSVISITYSAPMSSGGSYSITWTSSIDGSLGPIATASFTEVILTDTNGSVTGVPGATYTAVGNAPTQTTGTGSAIANAIYATGPDSSIESGLTVRYYTLANGAISSLTIENPGANYKQGQVFAIEGGGATFAISSVSNGDIYSYSIKNPGEDYIIGDIVDIPRPNDPNFAFSGTTASITITGITYSEKDLKGLSLDLTAGSGAMEGKIIAATISNPGLFYKPGEIFTIMGGNLDAIVRIDSVTGSITRLPDAYKIHENQSGVITLKRIGTQSTTAGLTAGGVFYTDGASNRWNHMSKSKIDRSKIKSGIFRRSYITRSLIRDAGYSSTDKDFTNKEKIKNLVLVDSLFSSGGNILSSATYMHSMLCGGSDQWNDGIIYKSIVSGMTFSKGVVKASSWLRGTFNGGTFYGSRSFNAQPTEKKRDYLANAIWLYYMKGEVGVLPSTSIIPYAYNGRYAWYDGTFNGGEFFKSDWDSGNFNGGLFYASKFYDGTINGGIFGIKTVAPEDTRVYNATVNNATVNNAYFYSEDTSFEGMSSSTISWYDGVFNSGVFGSNNNRILGYTYSTVSYDANVSALPIKDFKITQQAISVTDNTAISGEFEIEATITLKHTYIGDLIINLMAPNGKIINLKKKYSGGANDNMISSVFTSDADAPSIDIWTAPYTGRFKFAGAIGEGVYYNLQGTSVRGAYKAPVVELATINGIASVMPTVTPYDGDRYLVVATASDPSWSGQTVFAPDETYASNKLFPASLRNSIVEYKSSTGKWTLSAQDAPTEGDVVMTKTGDTLVYYRSTWTRSYHSNTRNISDLLNQNKTLTGTWKLLVMDDAGVDIGFVDDFMLSFSYKDSYLIREYKNYATWHDGIFNGGQFVDLGIWKNGKFNGGKFISTYGWTSSGDYLKGDSLSEEYTWQGGEFNGGEFGNESDQANSTWYTGEFNGGTFKGRLWNDGVFTYGEFKGGSSLPAVGSDSNSSAASLFIDAFRTGRYRGVWRKGIVSEKKDEFVVDKKIFTSLARATKPVEKDKKAIFENMLWIGGVFNHQSGEIKGSLWLDGLFKNGKMTKSAFNPYVRRFEDSKGFTKDDSCIWEGGTFENGEFHYSKWMQGSFISGTAVGMIWKNGVAGYMNAYNVFWENGLWKNGNWNGSSFEYTGKVEDGFAKEILNRGIEWSGTSSCHIWNLFETDSDKTSKMVSSDPVQDSFATDNQDDAGITPPSFINADLSTAPNSIVVSGSSITFNVRVNKGGATMSYFGIAYTSATSPNTAADPIVTLSGSGATLAVNTSGSTQWVPYPTPPPAGQPALSTVTEETLSIQVSGLDSTKYYNFRAVAVNREISQTLIEKDVRTVIPVTTGAVTPPAIAQVHSLGTGNIQITTSYTNTNTSNTNLTFGVQYSATNDFSTPLNGSYVSNTATTFVTGIAYSGLAGNTTYYFRTWADNDANQRSYSTVGQFTTGMVPPTVVATDPGTGSESTTLTLTLTSGGQTSLRYGFIIWPDTFSPSTSQINTAKSALNLAAPTIAADGTISGVNSTFKYIAAQLSSPIASGPQILTLPVQYTTPGSNYRFLAFAASLTPQANSTNNLADTDPATGNGTFKAASTAPTVTSTAILLADITSSGADLNGNVTSDGGAAITKRGIVYVEVNGAYPDPSGVTVTTSNATSGVYIASGTTGAMSAWAVTGLSSGKQYKFKAFAINSKGTAYSTPLTFSTKAAVSIGSRINSASAATRNLSAAAVVTNTDSTISAQGVYINASDPPTSNATTFAHNRQYYVRAYATNEGGTEYSTVENAYSLASVSTQAPTNIDKDAADAKISIPSQGTLGEKGVAWYPYGGSPVANSSKTHIVYTGVLGNNITIPISGLATGTRYAYEAYADAFSAGSAGWNQNTDGTGGVQRTYSGMIGGEQPEEFWTLAEITSGAITYASGTLTMPGVSISNAGGSSITRYGMIFAAGTGTVADPTETLINTPSDVPTTTPTSATSITPPDITKSQTFASGTIIKARPYVINNGGTFLGAVRQLNA